MEFSFVAKLWEWQGQGAWCFISLPTKYHADIKQITATPKRGFGSVRVSVTIGGTSWDTSIFPDSKTGTYLLPVKKTVRLAENIQVGKNAEVKITIKDIA